MIPAFRRLRQEALKFSAGVNYNRAQDQLGHGEGVGGINEGGGDKLRNMEERNRNVHIFLVRF